MFREFLGNSQKPSNFENFSRVTLVNSRTQMLLSFSFSNLEKFRGLPSLILEPRRCPHSRKPSKFENENEKPRGLRSRLTALVCVKSKNIASRVTLRPQWDRCRQGEAKVCILDFKRTWSVFQMPSQTAPAEAKARCVYSILKPHGQSFITSPESVQSSCVR